MSNRPKPTSLKLLNGNPGHKPLPAMEPQPDIAVPQCPSHLSTDARKEWRRITPELVELGVITRIDMAGLAAYCAAYGRWAEAERELKKHGLVIISPKGYEQKSPYLLIAEKALDQMRKFLIEFGLTPASRSKVASHPIDDADDEFFRVG